MAQLVALDVDGTILTRDYRVLPEVRAAIQGARSSGVTVALATARSFPAMHHVLEDIGGVDAAICFGGALTLHPTDAEPLATTTLSRSELEAIVVDARRLGVSLALYSLREVYVDRLDDHLRHEFEMTGAVGVETDLLSLEVPVIKGLALSDPSDPSALHELRALHAGRLGLVFSHVNFLEIMRAGVSKGHAVADLAGRLGVPMSEVMVVGDSENDLSMFAVAGLAVAMGNAPPEVQAKAHWVTRSNQEAGVAAAFARAGLPG